MFSHLYRCGLAGKFAVESHIFKKGIDISAFSRCVCFFMYLFFRVYYFQNDTIKSEMFMKLLKKYNPESCRFHRPSGDVEIKTVRAVCELAREMKQ